jgi:hypothetical protein
LEQFQHVTFVHLYTLYLYTCVYIICTFSCHFPHSTSVHPSPQILFHPPVFQFL